MLGQSGPAGVRGVRGVHACNVCAHGSEGASQCCPLVCSPVLARPGISSFLALLALRNGSWTASRRAFRFSGFCSLAEMAPNVGHVAP